MSNFKLKQALQEIKDYCHDADCEESCKFHINDRCILCSIPDEWGINEIGADDLDKWDKLYNWLNDTRLYIVPVFTAEVKEYNIRAAKVDLIDEIMEYMNDLDEEEHDET